MEKTNASLIEPVGEVNFHSSKWDLGEWPEEIPCNARILFYKKGLSFIIRRIFTGTSLNLGKADPFCLPFFASVYLIKRDRAPLALIGLVVGAATISLTNAAFTFAVTVFFLVIFESVKSG